MKNSFCLLFILSLSTSACTSSQLEKLSRIGNPPPMEKVKNPMEKGTLSWPMPESRAELTKTANSLWQPGSRTFFRDQRARTVGDLLRVKVMISDKAKFDNKTTRKRAAKENAGVTSLFGFEKQLFKLIPGKEDPTKLFGVDNKADNSGEGKIDRQETIETEMTAVIIQLLPNGNFFIRGSQEVRVNFELRRLTVEGIVRPEDISSENIIESNQIAEARISYGGDGQITDLQQPRVAHQIIDILSPF